MNTTIIPHHRLLAYLQLMRPANIVTAWADIAAGFAIAGTDNPPVLLWLLISTTGLYGGGVVANDIFDAELDAQERPERPIPSDRISRKSAIALSSILFSLGILAACQVSLFSLALATFIAVAAITYNAIAKHHPVIGPLNMGLCRGGNLLLGISVTPAIAREYWFLALIPIVYIAAITLISRGEVHGGKKSTALLALILACGVISALFTLGFLDNYQIIAALPFTIFFALRVLLPFVQAIQKPCPEQIRIAVRAGILSLVVLNATLTAGFAGLIYGLLVLSLLPLCTALAKAFTVT